MEELKNVTIIGATNRPDMLDDALMRPGRLERHIFIPPPDNAGRKQIFERYLRDAETLLTSELSIDVLVERTQGYVGADIEALVREAKLAAMREFISLMSGRSDREMEEAIANVRITSAHFEEAFARVRGSLDEHARTMYSRQAWHILYHQDQQKILTTAADLIAKADEKGIVEPELTELRDLIFGEGRKDFSQIKRRTQELDKKYQHI